MNVGGRYYTDLTTKYKFKAVGGDLEAFLTVNNLFDRDPPASPTRVGTPVSILNTNPTLYDIVGRFYTAGMRFNVLRRRVTAAQPDRAVRRCAQSDCQAPLRADSCSASISRSVSSAVSIGQAGTGSPSSSRENRSICSR